jgi:hypothetical protein
VPVSMEDSARAVAALDVPLGRAVQHKCHSEHMYEVAVSCFSKVPGLFDSFSVL